MTALEASFVIYRLMVDGTLRVQIDFEPRDCAQAVAMFSAPGVPVAVAALKTGTQKAQEAATEAKAPKGGIASQWLAQRCKEPAFQAWVNEDGEDATAERVRRTLDVESRAEIDCNPAKFELFQKLIRRPWMKESTGYDPQFRQNGAPQ